MRNNIIQQILDQITPEEHAQFERQMLEEWAYSRWLEEQGKEYGTDTSISLDIVREAGFNPIGICYYGSEETFVFKSKKEANSAYKKLEKEQGKIYAWWYSKKDFEREIAEDEAWYKPSKMYWL